MKKLFLLIVISLCGSSILFAQNTNKKMLILSSGSHDTAEVRNMYWEASTGFYRESSVPSFVFVAPNAGFSLGISGNVSVVGEYDFKGIMNNQYFLPFAIDVPTNKVPGQLQAYMNTSTLNFKVIQKTKHGNIVGNLYTNFTGANGNLEIFFGYISYFGFTVGKNWSTFVDLGAMAQTVNWGVINSTSDAINYQVQYKKSFGKHFSLAASLELVPISPLVSAPGIEEMPQRLPDVPLYLQWGWKNGSHVRASGVLTNIAYKDTIKAENRTVTGWGGQVSAVVQIGKPFTFKFHGIYGEGIGSYIQDLEGNNLNATADIKEPGELNALPVYAYYAGLQANLTSTLMASAGYGQVRVAPVDAARVGSMYDFTQQATANLWWTFIPSAQVALEYCWGKRVNMDNTSGVSNRIELMLQYNF